MSEANAPESTKGIRSWGESRVRKTLSSVNICNGLLLVGLSLVLLLAPVVGLSPSFAAVTLCCYLIILGLIFTCLELRVNYYARRLRTSLGFLFHPFGRGIFLFFAASVALAAGTAGGTSSAIMMWCLGIATAANGVFNIVIIHYHPYAKIQDIPLDEEEVSEYGANNGPSSRSAETVAADVMLDYLSKNPELTKRVFKDFVLPNAMRSASSSSSGASTVIKPGLALLAQQHQQERNDRDEEVRRLSRGSRIKLAAGESSSVEAGGVPDVVVVHVPDAHLSESAKSGKGKKQKQQNNKKESKQSKSAQARGPMQEETNASVVQNPFHIAAQSLQPPPDTSADSAPSAANNATTVTANPYALALAVQQPDASVSAGPNASVTAVPSPPIADSKLVKFSKSENALKRAFARKEARSPEDFYVPAPNSILRNPNSVQATRYRYSFGVGDVVPDTSPHYSYLTASQRRVPGMSPDNGPLDERVPRQSAADLKWATRTLDGIEYDENVDESGAINPFL